MDRMPPSRDAKTSRMLLRQAVCFGVACFVTLAVWLASFFPVPQPWRGVNPLAVGWLGACAAWLASGKLADARLSSGFLLLAYSLLIGLLDNVAPSPPWLLISLIIAAGSGAVLLIASGFTRILQRFEDLRRGFEMQHQSLQERGHLLLERVDALCFTLDQNGRVVSPGKRLETLLGPALHAGAPFQDYLAAEDVERFHFALRNRVSDADSVLNLTLKPGSPATAILLNMRALGDGQTECIARSLHAIRILEERLQVSRQHETVAVLARGIAHDFTNLLTLMRGYLEILRPEIPQSPSNLRYLAELDESVRRATVLTGKILAYGKPEGHQRVAVELTELVRQSHPLLQRMAGGERLLQMLLPSGPVVIVADPVQIEQALMNLVLNARDATCPGESVAISIQKAGDGTVELAVSDTGAGMDTETQNRAFEPFFTTKPNGYGIGLSTVKAIVEENQGTIRVVSEPGQGTTVALAFALAMDGFESRKTRTVLVVDDEQSVRKLVQSILVKSGYAVISAADGLEALEKLSLDKTRVDLLLSDVLMPGLSGHQLARQVRSFIPNLRILMMSGFNAEDSAVRTEWPLIQKPFTPKALLRRVEEVLTEGEQG